MAHLSGKEATANLHADCSLPIADTYANAILRTLASFKPPSPPISFPASRQHRRSYPHSKTVLQSAVVNEVSGIQSCMRMRTRTLHCLTVIFKWKLMGVVPPFFLFSFSYL